MIYFCVGIEVHLIFVWVIKIDLSSVCRIKINLISVQGSNLTRLL